MPDEMKTEAMELCVTACEKFSSNNEVTSQFTVTVFRNAIHVFGYCSKLRTLVHNAMHVFYDCAKLHKPSTAQLQWHNRS